MQYSKLKKAVSLLACLLPKKTQIPEFEYFGFFGKRAFAYNGNQALILHDDFDFSGYIKGEELKKFFQEHKLPKAQHDLQVSFKQENFSDICSVYYGEANQGVVSCTQKSLLSTFNENFSVPKNVRNTLVGVTLRKDLLEILKTSLTYSKKNSSAEILNGVYVEGKGTELRFCTSNNEALFHYKYPMRVRIIEPFKVVIPYYFVDLLTKIPATGAVLHLGRYMASVSNDYFTAVTGLYSAETSKHLFLHSIIKKKNLTTIKDSTSAIAHIKKVKKTLGKDEKEIRCIFKDKMLTILTGKDGLGKQFNLSYPVDFRIIDFNISSSLFEKYLKDVDQLCPSEVAQTPCLYGQSRAGYDITISGMGDPS